MAYCELTDIEKRIPESVLVDLTDDAGAGTVDEDVVDAAIADADEEIDAWLGMHYSLPFETTPAMVLRMSADLSVCNLYARRDHLELPKQWSDRCAQARRTLERLADGRLVLDIPDPSADADNGIDTTAASSDRIFTMGRVSDGSSGSLDNY